ncbi:MAG TPA: amidohydrolase family protein [Sphingobium sp.]
MQDFDCIIRSGRIVDGTGAAAFTGDIAITAGRIVRVGKLPKATAREVIDAGGRIVAPGHITQHAHYDAAIFWSPHCMDSGEHGVTTILNANCGFSIAPVRAADRERTMLMLSTTEQIPVEQQRLALSWDWETFPEYLDTVRALPKSVNLLTYIPLNPLLIYVMGIEGAKTRRPTAEEIAEIHALIHEGMDAGAVGISMSVMGMEGNSHLDFDGTAMPTDALHDDDVVEICRALADRGDGIIQMLAQIGNFGNAGLTEKVARMAKGTGVRVIHNIFLAIDGMSAMIDADLAWLNRLRAEGLDIVGATLLHAGWVEAGIRDLDTAAGQLWGVRKLIGCANDEEIRALLKDPEFVRSFAEDYAKNGPSNGAGGLEAQVVIAIGDAPDLQLYLGRTLEQIAQEIGATVVEVLCDLALRSDLALQIKSAPYAAMDGSLGARLLAHPGVSCGVSDGGAHTKAFSSGCYATDMLIRIVREQKAMTLEDMHYQLSFKIAKTLHLEERGALLPGMWADILIYDLDALYLDRNQHRIVHDLPGGDWRRLVDAGGYHRVLVNGVTTFIEGVPTGAEPGRLLANDNGREPALAAAE